MLHLPPHVICGIIAYSDTCSRICIAATCTVLRPFAEEYIWNTIDLSRYPCDSSNNRAYTASSAISTILEALEIRPERLSFVKRLDVSPTKYDIQPLTCLIVLLSHRITHLKLQPVATHLLHHPNSPFSVLEQANFVLADAGVRFGSLQHLSISMDDMWRDLAQGILLNAPRLQSLRLLESKTELSNLVFPDSIHFDNLRDITVDYLTPQLAQPLIQLIRSMNVRVVNLTLAASGQSQADWVKSFVLDARRVISPDSLRMYESVSGDVPNTTGVVGDADTS